MITIEGQLSVMDLVPRSCPACGHEVTPDRPYDYRRITKMHAEVEPGVCKEMARWKRNYLHAVWAIAHFDEWFDLAEPGTERYSHQLESQRYDVDLCRRRSVEYFGEEAVESWTSVTKTNCLKR